MQQRFDSDNNDYQNRIKTAISTNASTGESALLDRPFWTRGTLGKKVAGERLPKQDYVGWAYEESMLASLFGAN